MKYVNNPILQINLVNDEEKKIFTVFNFDAPYLRYETDDLEDLLDYLDMVLCERI